MTLILSTLGLLVWGYSATYAWKDWYRSLCGLILFDAVVRLFPRNLFDVPGLNPWNLLLFIVVVAWIQQRRRERLRWDMAKTPRVFLWLGLGLLVSAFARLFLDVGSLVEPLTIGGIVSDFLVNPLKVVVVGLLLFDGCRDRRRLALGIGSILSLNVLLALQVIGRTLPDVALSGGGETLSLYALRTVAQDIGLHRNDVSVMLAGAAWALFAVCPSVASRNRRVAILVASAVVTLAVVLTGGRGGYGAWCFVGLTLAFVRWRRNILLIPLAITIAAVLVPSAAERALHGVSDKIGLGQQEEIDLNEYQLTSGRNLIWPLVIEKIWTAPVLGFGLAAMQRTGISDQLIDKGIERGFMRHPHNAYLEMLLDGGAVGLLISTGFYGLCLIVALSFVRDRRDPERAAVGGLAVAFVLALLVGSFSGQTLWPKETVSLGMWCAIGLLLRVWVQRTWMPPTVSLRSVDEMRDVVGLYLDPPDRVLVLCADEKSQIQALDRTQRLRPMRPGPAERRAHDYARDGTPALFAALDVKTGTVIGRRHRRYRAVEFRKFLDAIDEAVPAELDVHLIFDDYATILDKDATHKAPLIRRWLSKRPRFHLHFTPTGASWIKLVERWFATLTEKQIRRGIHRNTRALETAITEYIAVSNEQPRPFRWIKTADEVLASVERSSPRRTGPSGAWRFRSDAFGGQQS